MIVTVNGLPAPSYSVAVSGAVRRRPARLGEIGHRVGGDVGAGSIRAEVVVHRGNRGDRRGHVGVGAVRAQRRVEHQTGHVLGDRRCAYCIATQVP